MLRIGKKQIEAATGFATSLVGFGGAGFCTLLYFTDWRVFTNYIPFYSGKYAGLDEEEQNEKI